MDDKEVEETMSDYNVEMMFAQKPLEHGHPLIENERCMICGDKIGDDPRIQLTPHYYVHKACLEIKTKKLNELRRKEKLKEKKIQAFQDLTWDDY